MAIINVEINTDNREFVVNMDGTPMNNFKSVFMDAFVNSDGTRDVSLSITQEVPLDNGLVTTRTMRLATPEEQEQNGNSLITEEGTTQELGARQLVSFYKATK
jgi:hypothetical protein